MGVVYRCHDGRLGRDVAVKVARDPDHDRARFVREARLHSKLQHPAIVPVYDLDTAQDGRDFLVMREVEGRTLRKVLKGIAAGEDVGFGRHALLTAFARVCMAVDYCHRRGVLHRDLKPENVMLGDFGEVYVLDWGIAMERGDTTARTGGTKGYAAPEQLAGINGERGDVYSLGVILAEILGAHGDDDAPPELLALARRAADTDPAARPESPRVLAAAIDRFLEGEHDLALRKKLADAAADAAMRATSTSDLGAQREAMRLAGRALALDPDHRGAAIVLHRVLTAPVSATPTDVADKARRNLGAAIRSAAAAAGWGMVAVFGLMPLELVMGVNAPGWFLARVVLTGLAVVACFGLARGWWRPSPAAVTAAVLISLAQIASTSLVVGPFILIPSVAVLLSAALALLAGRRWLGATTLVALAMIVVPLVAELTGVVPRSFEFTSAGILVRPRLLQLPATPTLIYLLLKELFVMLVVGAMMSRFQAVLADAKEELAMRAWQLEQLLP
jgi:eukaryotic-like serine/threonine-protein kinase